MQVCILLVLAYLVLCAFPYPVSAESSVDAKPAKWRAPKDNSPGVEFRLEETNRKTLKNGTAEVTYRLSASGFPQDKNYSLWINRITEEPFKIVHRMFVDESGEMFVRQVSDETDVAWLPAPLATVLPLSVSDFLPAEPLFLSIISEDETVKGRAVEYPLPIEDKDGSCHLYLEMIEPGRVTFAAWGQGFRPDEEVLTESRSGKEVIRSSMTVNADGGFLNILAPQVVGKKRGTASFSVTALSCNVSVDYDWGARKK